MFKIGDDVKIVKKVVNSPTFCWDEMMYDTIGMVGEIYDFDDGWGTYLVETDIGDWWYYPESLELVNDNQKVGTVNNMPKFEYMMVPQVSGKSIENLEEWFNTFGEEGWELCGIGYGCCIFKRRKD